MGVPADTLSLFHPVIATWFQEAVGLPTEAQTLGWPTIAKGEHVLICAPTGSGKTLTAFLWAINQLVTGNWNTGHTNVLYVSPLKALNNDIYRNLIGPLEDLKGRFEGAGESFPPVRVGVRSGDTPQSERRAMVRHPPEILITTPESLNLLLSSNGGRTVLRGISTVILDEIHSVVGNKRGVHLITAVERLALLCGEFQRLALSATIEPLGRVAEFIGGFRMEGTANASRYIPRPVSTVISTAEKQYDIRVRFPEGAREQSTQESFWEPFVGAFKKVIDRNRSTLLFVNNRGLCEKLTLKINLKEDRPVAYAHHGSLSREIRGEVEKKLKAGELRAIVATNSLELGIDIGALDEVVLIQSPPAISSSIQRVGRAGHRVGEVSRGTIVPTHSLDLLEAAVLGSGIIEQDLESTEPVHCPLDVLAQIIVSMVGTEMWDLDALFAHLRTSYPYRQLSREQYDLVLNMLAGRYADTRIRELEPRISIDRLDNTVTARKGALLALYFSGGTIPDRGYFNLRHHETNARIGDLDEEFVWEASIGQIFSLGTQNWKIERITHNDVFVRQSRPKAIAPPFWKGEGIYRDFHFSTRIAEFLEEANERLNDPDISAALQRENRMDRVAAEELIAFLIRQRERTGCDLPHRHHLVIEFVNAGPASVPGNQMVLHTFWGGRVNQPFAMALDAAWKERFGHRIEVYAGNDSIVLQLPQVVTAEELLSLVTSQQVESMLRKRLEGSGYFGARFRECAGRALLFNRRKINERMPLWMTRLRSQKLLDAVLPYDDFPILLEAWRTCLQDEFDMAGLYRILGELESGLITWSETRTSRPSPMAQAVTWGQINQYMYRDDGSPSGKRSKLRRNLLRDVVHFPGLRPAVTREIADRFEHKRQRLSPGYSPASLRDLVDWVKERVVIPESEWDHLTEVMKQDHGEQVEEWLESAGNRLTRIVHKQSNNSLIVALERLPQIIHGFYGTVEKIRIEPLSRNGEGLGYPVDGVEPSDQDPIERLTRLLGEWLQYYGPLPMDHIPGLLGVKGQRLRMAVNDLIDSERVVAGELLKGGEEGDICDSENFESLLRIMRAESIPQFEPLGIDNLPLFLATYQGIVNPPSEAVGLKQTLEQLLCYPTPASLWEKEILPSRLSRYDPSWLDTLMQEGELRWIGNEKQNVSFCFESDLDLMEREEDGKQQNAEPQGNHEVSALFPDMRGRYDFSTLLRMSESGPSEVFDKLWEGVWMGLVSNDSFLSLRKGIETRFKMHELGGTGNRRSRGGRRTGLARWKQSLPFAGNWFSIIKPELGSDLIQREERNKDRVRLLLDRYGLLFRELLLRESPPFQWSNLFRSLRLMELSGEILAGYFFHGIPGPQFISHRAFRMLQRELPKDAIWWINATDPTSLCGTPLDAVRGMLPKRLENSHLVYHGNRLVMVSTRRGKSLRFHVPPEDPHIHGYLGPLRHLLMREFQPERRIAIETINEEKATQSPYLDALRTAFDVIVDYKQVSLYRKQ